jgi:hypothetical protein
MRIHGSSRLDHVGDDGAHHAPLFVIRRTVHADDLLAECCIPGFYVIWRILLLCHHCLTALHHFAIYHLAQVLTAFHWFVSGDD